ncbi:NAD(P)-binding protein [Cystobasidium minutum MCA 4210]|uniref:NAD(P)-binding protein n=1 Tax=Cystobasidium minutum MCA 4210 TaxID=1397322 RepID=UPI0034CFC025|eukprot:jgi/Rhomi1/210668/estExt_Genemark1.C_4_t10231
MVFAPKSVLVTGATTQGIGRALALALHDLPSQPKIIVTGRQQDKLDELASTSQRIYGKRLDQLASKEDLQRWARQLLNEHQDIDTIILNAGIQIPADFSKPDTIDLDALQEELYVNYTSQLILATAFLPHLLRLAKAGQVIPRLVLVTSGLSVVPSSFVPNYCATKAALHSLALSMRFKLEPHGVKVIEIVPPLVESQLHDKQGTNERLSKFWMPLKDFTEATMAGLQAEDEVVAVGMSKEAYESHEAGKHAKLR